MKTKSVFLLISIVLMLIGLFVFRNENGVVFYVVILTAVILGTIGGSPSSEELSSWKEKRKEWLKLLFGLGDRKLNNIKILESLTWLIFIIGSPVFFVFTLRRIAFPSETHILKIFTVTFVLCSLAIFLIVNCFPRYFRKSEFSLFGWVGVLAGFSFYTSLILCFTMFAVAIFLNVVKVK